MITPQNINLLPMSYGCYLFKNSDGVVIYVGKANELRKRVSNYFQNKILDIKTQLLVNDVRDIDFIVTGSEVEALILENNLIKKYYPKYNLDLKDGRSYSYICLRDGDYPYLEVERVRIGKGEFYGPFISGSIRRTILDVLTRNFKILTKKPSPRLKKIIDKDSYNKRIDMARKILGGKVDELIEQLTKEMNNASDKTFYEYANTLKKQILALESLKEKQYIEMKKAYDSNVINYLIINDRIYLLVFSVRKGVLEGKEEFDFDNHDGVIEEFLLRYYDSAPIPNEIIIPNDISPAISDYLSGKKGSKVSVIIPQKGEKFELLDLVLKNVHATFFKGREALIDLQKELGLKKIPRIIECFDISHLSGTNTVASMVTFIDGMPNKSNYRKFRIRVDSGGDDFLAMQEVVSRRYSKVVRDGLVKPDLVVIDGGRGQLNAASSIIHNLSLKLDVISLAKRLEEIYTNNHKEPLLLSRKNKGLQLLQAIRDEAHRFAINYQRLLRKKELLGDRK